MDGTGRRGGLGNPVLRGDLRARSASRKVWTLLAIYLGILGALVFLGLPPEFGRFAESHQASLYVAVLWVQMVATAYAASACASGEVAVEGEKNPIDLLFAPFTPGTIVAGKTAASLVMIAVWLLLGAPLLALAAGVRQFPLGALLPASVLIGVVAWGIAEMGLLYAAWVESEFARTLAHWTTLGVIFVGTAAGPPALRALNPLIATTAAAAGTVPAGAAGAYAAFGLGAAVLTGAHLRRAAAQ